MDAVRLLLRQLEKVSLAAKQGCGEGLSHNSDSSVKGWERKRRLEPVGHAPPGISSILRLVHSYHTSYFQGGHLSKSFS